MQTRLDHFARLVSVMILVVLLTACGGSPASTSGGAVGNPMPTSEAVALEPQLTSDAQERDTAHFMAAPTPNVAATSEPASDIVPPATVQPVLVNPFERTSDDSLSTFGLDVDTASYAAARNYITSGMLPPADIVRVEEFVNYFRYDYPSPKEGAFGIHIDAAPSLFGEPGTQIVRVGIQGQRIDTSQRSDAVLTFVIDISGSMQESNRLPLVKQALRLLVDELRPTDQVAIVVYGSTAWTVLEHTSVTSRDEIIAAIDSLQNDGSTNAEEGLKLGYSLAAKHYKPHAINRVILCSDGVANVGATGPDAIRKVIRDQTAQGVLLTTVGFGMGDYNDHLMEQLADDGNGNYAYVDSLDEARRIFVENLTGTLQVIAKDAKVQVAFNPAVVSQYRLLGYENRAVADADFRNDKVDAGEIGAGHSVTALYEVVMTEQSSGTALTVQMRYADPKTGTVHELQQPFESTSFGQDFSQASPRLQLAVAVASLAEHLRGSGYAQQRTPADIRAIVERVMPQLSNDGDIQELLQLLVRVEQMG